MSDVRNKPCMSHYPDFDHYCASKGQGCEYYEGQDEKLEKAIDNCIKSMTRKDLELEVYEQLSDFYFGNTVCQEQIDFFLQVELQPVENKPDA
jgi:hypothetical protein